MYYANNKKFNFYIQRNTWEYTIAKVISIEGVIEGKEIPGKAPYYNNPIVMAEFYKEEYKENCNKDNINNISEVNCPGNFSYDMC